MPLIDVPFTIQIQGQPIIMIDETITETGEHYYYIDEEDITDTANTPDGFLLYQGIYIQLTDDFPQWGIHGMAMIYNTVCSVNDTFVTYNGVKIRVTPTGKTLVIGGITRTLYMFCYVYGSMIPPGTTVTLVEYRGIYQAVADTQHDGKGSLMIFADGISRTPFPAIGPFQGFGPVFQEMIWNLQPGVVIPQVNGKTVIPYDSVYGLTYAILDELAGHTLDSRTTPNLQSDVSGAVLYNKQPVDSRVTVPMDCRNTANGLVAQDSRNVPANHSTILPNDSRKAS